MQKRKYIEAICEECGKVWSRRSDYKIKGNKTRCMSCASLNRRTAKYSSTTSNNDIYSLYQTIKTRCYNAKSINYHSYGELEISMCDEWLNDYGVFESWALENGYRKGLTIDKDILCDKYNIRPKIYSPDTCIFISRSENSKYSNRKISEDEREVIRKRYSDGGITMQELADEYSVARSTIYYIKNGDKR